MANREGEFALVIEPDNDAHIIRFSAVRLIIEALHLSIGRGVWLRLGDERFDLYLSSSPEFGSIRFNLFAGVTLASALAIAADASQITGVELGDIFKAMQHLVAPSASAAPPQEVDQFVRDQGFRELFGMVLSEAVRSGYPSVKIKAGDVEIELTRPAAPLAVETEIERLHSEIAGLQEEIDRLQKEQDRYDNPRRKQFPGRASLEQDMKQATQRRLELDRALARLNAHKESHQVTQAKP